ncbi:MULTISPECIES: S1 family peptidase [unclassified Coleofasciculus]|uniref:S1 family peptidase n=1 Tax=unclassified Coleofasciculus TaxID=2692782 RepID=UPI0018827D69|nr:MULTISPECIES: serine protease [unclassified Coleofasciculus]MBE9125913.1 trypsin-like peptidase domain-containing protein [Coleofasciculus sp. LEGE 07081]MBE9149284.1 trypsin-like peptidase domain-containing protein [Coleofasciculus sp. LEGE 07092]
MKRKLLVLAMGAASSILVVLAGRAQIPSKVEADVVEADSVGVLLLGSDAESEPYYPLASGVYLGRGIVLTNWHAATYAALLLLEDIELKPTDELLTYKMGDRSNSLIYSWICLAQTNTDTLKPPNSPYWISPTDADNCIPYNLTPWQAFRPSEPNQAPMPTAQFEELLFLNRSMELAIVKLDPQDLAKIEISPPCLSKVPVKKGETLTVQSHVGGRYPAVTVTAIVKDDQPQLRVDPDPRVPVDKRYAAMSIIATLPADQSNSVGPGSSGGPVFNQRGELVGLVWTGQYLDDGTMEVWITPTSSWLPLLEQEKVPDEDLRQVVEAPCPAISNSP